ncbi:iron ABC transporter permease [Shimia sp. CNT1-13L.2]|uniref:FecCD family ABC transporter permease n=1 Tax=Shimia sp. CNT1-13L.2 TaxID=2959663 RepID=UPI0020CD9CAE|nr:iron ABC transporter permease [Shimia sp. CNT1-13L.2]MCP9484077.1 iron ABC transporter permease [Shimia sp. CNT1-13L.2]
MVATLGFALVVGETRIPLEVIWSVLRIEAGYTAPEVNPIDHGILWSYRLPRAIVAMACGMSLALSGVVLQALLRNPLSDPYILGLSAGASTGAVAVAILGFGAGALTLSSGAFIGAMLAFGFVAWLARLARGPGSSATSSLALLLAGVAGAQLFHALTALIIAKSADANQARGIMFWMMGNLSGSRWPDVYLAVPVALAGAGVIFAHFRALDAMTFGREAAQSMGIRTGLVMAVLIGVAALLTAVMVSLTGAIGFVGLVVPHAMRFMVGVQHARLIPATALAGGIFLILADIVARVLIPGQTLPIGVVTALVGAPAFAVILVRSSRAHSS